MELINIQDIIDNLIVVLASVNVVLNIINKNEVAALGWSVVIMCLI